MEYYVYILYSEKCDKYYVGHTVSLERRVIEHNTGKGGGFSKNCSPWKLMYYETLPSIAEAIKREKEIKSRKSRKYIEQLIGMA